MIISNSDYYEAVKNHQLTKLLLGKLCHATTISNYRAIIETGVIVADSGHQGLLERRRSNPRPSTCQRHNAISIFDFTGSHDDIFKLYRTGEDEVYEYVLHWWDYFWLKAQTAIIVLDPVIRAGIIPRDTLKDKGQFIEGTEACHPGPISSSQFMSYILITGRRDPIQTFDEPIPNAVLLSSETSSTEPLTREQEEALKRIQEILGSYLPRSEGD